MSLFLSFEIVMNLLLIFGVGKGISFDFLAFLDFLSKFLILITMKFVSRDV
jgi:hypothetical protein